jgi:vacuolar protein sorting-associated protein 26
LAAPGELRQAQTFDFLFKNVEKQYESYLGINVKLRCVTTTAVLTLLLPSLVSHVLARCAARYFIRVTISRRMSDVIKEMDIWVHSFRMPPDSNNSIKMEVGIEDCLHIEFEYNKSK